MGLDIQAHARRLKAEAKHQPTADWVDVTVISAGKGEESTITVFFDGPDAARKADAYAKAINTVDQAFHPLIVRADRILGATERA